MTTATVMIPTPSQARRPQLHRQLLARRRPPRQGGQQRAPPNRLQRQAHTVRRLPERINRQRNSHQPSCLRPLSSQSLLTTSPLPNRLRKKKKKKSRRSRIIITAIISSDQWTHRVVATMRTMRTRKQIIRLPMARTWVAIRMAVSNI